MITVRSSNNTNNSDNNNNNKQRWPRGARSVFFEDCGPLSAGNPNEQRANSTFGKV